MTRNFQSRPVAPTFASKACRFGAGNASNQRFSQNDMNKAVKLTLDSTYDLCVAGDEIEGVVTSIEARTENGWSFGGIGEGGMIWAQADGLQATPGTGVIAVGDYVLASTITALNTVLAGTGYPKVVKATTQASAKATPFAWRVISQGPAASGAVGTAIVLQRMGVPIAPM